MVFGKNLFFLYFSDFCEQYSRHRRVEVRQTLYRSVSSETHRIRKMMSQRGMMI